MEIDGLPLHPLVVHAVVVLVPLTCLLAVAFALLPAWRWLTRWVVVALAVGGAATSFVATRSGQSLSSGKQLETAPPHLRALIEAHAEHGNRLALFTLGLAVLVLVCALLLPGPSGLVSGRGAVASRFAVADRVLPIVLLVAVVVVLVQVYLTGESGARSVWGS